MQLRKSKHIDKNNLLTYLKNNQVSILKVESRKQYRKTRRDKEEI